MAIHQISVFLENRAGQLAEITALLAKNGVDLRAINIAETSDYGVLRLIASHEPEACRVLRENGFIFSTSDVVAVGVPDAPGGLSTLLQLLAENSIDVHYMYSIFGQPNGMACMILRVADPAAVSSLLAANGIHPAGAETLGIISAEYAGKAGKHHAGNEQKKQVIHRFRHPAHDARGTFVRRDQPGAGLPRL